MSVPSNAVYELGCMAYERGDYEAAISFLREAIALRPEEPERRHALGAALLRAGAPEQAQVSLERAIALDPRPQFWNDLGVLLKTQGAYAPAAEAFQQALAADASFLDAEYNLGNCRRLLGDLQAAARCFSSVLTRDDAHVHALAALGQTLKQAGQPGDAVAYLRRARKLAFDDLHLRCELASAEEACGNLDVAFNLYEQVAEAGPDAANETAQAWYGMGCIRNRQKDFAEARRCFASAVTLQPDWLEARHNLGQTLFELGYVSEAAAEFRWCGEQKGSGISRAMLAVVIPGDPTATNRDILLARQEWCRPYCVAAADSMPRVPPLRRDRLRIGYISAFFGRDPWMKPVWGLLNAHDRKRFALHIFSDCALADCAASAGKGAYRQQADDVFHDTSALANGEILRRMKEAQLDILIDLNGYSSMRRLPLFFARPAPVVIGWFNYYATSGLPNVDYLIGDEEVIPVDEESCYTERILRVQGSYLTFQVHYPVPAVEPRQEADRFVFGCLGSQYKLTPEVLATWSNILQGAPDAVLLIKNKVLSSASAKADLLERFAQWGIGPERLELEGSAEHFEFLRTYARMDLALDTFPYNGGTTTTEAIWQGVPVLSFRGDRWVSRTSASLLRAGGLGRFVATDLRGYVELAIRYATEPELRRELRATRLSLRQSLRDSSVCDVHGFTRRMEDLLCSLS